MLSPKTWAYLAFFADFGMIAFFSWKSLQHPGWDGEYYFLGMIVSLWQPLKRIASKLVGTPNRALTE